MVVSLGHEFAGDVVEVGEVPAARGPQRHPSPAGTPNPVDGWAISNELFEEAPLVGTPDSVYAAFGFEAINGAENRTVFMQKVLQYLSGSGG